MKWFPWKLEATFAGLLLLVLLILVLPTFFRAQARGNAKRIQNQLQIVMTALQNYIVDHQQAPPIFYQHLSEQPGAYFSYMEKEFYYESLTWKEIQSLLSPLIQGNYLKSIPAILSNVKKYDSRYIGVTVHHLYIRKTDTKRDETLNWGIAVGWPSANREKGQWIEITPQTYPSPEIDFEDFTPDFGYKKYFESKRRPSKGKKSTLAGGIDSIQLDFTIPLIDPKACYHPSNGIESAGAVYADLKGKRIP
jgi:type II secretory pathway pseudopilin PulG